MLINFNKLFNTFSKNQYIDSRDNSISSVIRNIRLSLLNNGVSVKTKSWQGKTNPPEFIEILHVNEKIKMENDIDNLIKESKALLPWAEDHFNERVSGIPLNPPPSHTQWLRGTSDYLSGDKFSHSYPERYWPKSIHSEIGIRFKIGDLDDVIEKLKLENDSRQCYLPIYYPEDVHASLIGERVPCTLGYQFIIRNNTLDIFYPMRSCDAVRHLHNDIYLTNRLGMYIRDKLNIPDLKLGIINFTVTSLHSFKNDIPIIKELVK